MKWRIDRREKVAELEDGVIMPFDSNGLWANYQLSRRGSKEQLRLAFNGDRFAECVDRDRAEDVLGIQDFQAVCDFIRQDFRDSQ